MDGVIADIKSKRDMRNTQKIKHFKTKKTSNQKTDQVAFPILKANAVKRKSNQEKQDWKILFPYWKRKRKETNVND